MADSISARELKQAIRDGYTRRLDAGSCCGGTCGQTGISERRERLARDLGYAPDEVARLPEGAVVNSFGCGNPLAMAGLGTGDVVLDVGSGAGIDCLLASRLVGPTGRVIGVDMTTAMVDAARRNAERAGAANVEFRLGEAESLPVVDDSVDWVVSNCVINLAPDKERVFREVARVLRPGGRVSISDIVFADDLPELPAVVRADLEAHVGCVAGAVTESEYLSAMETAGLSNAAVVDRVVYGDDFLDGFLSEMAARWGGGARARDAVDEIRRCLSGRVFSIRVEANKGPGGSEGAPVSASCCNPPARPGESPDEIKAVLGPANTADLPAIEGLLRESGLPAGELPGNLENFTVARLHGRVVGCVGFEAYGSTALVRSLAVSPDHRRQGIGGWLLAAVLTRLRATGFRRAVLLTHTIESMAAAFGFRAVDRRTLPEEVLGSWEFRAHCCDSAVAMARDIAG